MNLALVLKIVTILAENAGAVPELVSLYTDIKNLIEGHSTQGTQPTEQDLADLAARVKSIHDQIQAS